MGTYHGRPTNRTPRRRLQPFLPLRAGGGDSTDERLFSLLRKTDNMALVFASTGKQMGATHFTPCPKWETFRIDGANILWEPGVYQGTGDENRVNVCVRNDNLTDTIRTMEQGALSGNVCSCIKTTNDSNHVKAKMSWDKIIFYDSGCKPVDRPPSLAGFNCNLMFAVKGKWACNGQVGLSLELTHCQLLETIAKVEKCPFTFGNS